MAGISLTSAPPVDIGLCVQIKLQQWNSMLCFVRNYFCLKTFKNKTTHYDFIRLKFNIWQLICERNQNRLTICRFCIYSQDDSFCGSHGPRKLVQESEITSDPEFQDALAHSFFFFTISSNTWRTGSLGEEMIVSWGCNAPLSCTSISSIYLWCSINR